MGHKVTVVTPNSRGTTDVSTVDGIKTHRLKSIGYPKLNIALNFKIRYVLTPSNLSYLYRLISENGYDLIHVHGQMFDISWMGALCARKRKIPAVITIHAYMEHPESLTNYFLRLVDRLFLRLFVRQFQGVIVRDVRGLEYVGQRYGIPSDRQHLIIGGIDQENVKAQARSPFDDEIALQWKNKGCFVISSVGHLHKLRDRMTLFKALEIIVQSNPRIKVLIAGDVLYQSPLEYLQERNLVDFVEFLGNCSHGKTLNVIAQSNVEVHDLDGIGIGIANQEAMALGKPVIVGAREDNFGHGVLGNWENIIVIPPGDHVALANAILKLMQNPDLGKSIGERASETIASHFTWDINVQKTLDLCQSLIRKTHSQVASESENGS